MKTSLFAAALAPMLAALATAATAAPPPASPPAPLAPAADQAEARALLKELVELNTTHPHGTLIAAQAIKAHLLKAGFADADLQILAPAEHPNSASLVVRYHGKHVGKPALFMGHLDVVEAKREDWTTDPFVLTEQDGYFYGRGSEDMKDGDAVMAQSLMRLKRQGFVPDHDLIVMFTADEEAGGDANGPTWLLKTHRDLIDAATAYNFDGGGGTLTNGKRTYFDLGTSEKIYLTFTLETTGPGGHGSLPGRDNPIYRLTDGLGRLEAYTFPTMTTATTRASFKAFADLTPGPDSADLRAVAADTPDPAAAARLSEGVQMNAELRTTCVATLISGGHAENALPQRARATIQCRLMPYDTSANVQATLVRVLNDPKISVAVDTAAIVSPESEPTPQVLARLAPVIHSMWPGVPIIPTMATGFSDGRQTRNAGIPTYDVGGLWGEAGENRTHGRDERIQVKAFDEDVEYAYRLMKALGSDK
jgi:acetylornithine deacetylase/succinyl-diaminopimelate desuccinylase-like protein